VLLCGEGARFRLASAPRAAWIRLALLALLGRRPWITALAFVAAGTLLPVLRPPEPPPELDAAAGETLLIQGCVVEPSVFADRREQFTLDLEHDARARVKALAAGGWLTHAVPAAPAPTPAKAARDGPETRWSRWTSWGRLRKARLRMHAACGL
jgi:hypothetical protein